MTDTAGNIKIDILISSKWVAERMLKEFASAFNIKWASYKIVRAKLQQEYEKRVFPPLNDRVKGEVRARLKAKWEREGKDTSGVFFQSQVNINFDEWTKLGKDKTHRRRSQEQQRINVCYDILENGFKPESEMPSGLNMDEDGSSTDDENPQPNTPPPPRPDDDSNNTQKECESCSKKIHGKGKYCKECFRQWFIENRLKNLWGWKELSAETQQHYLSQIDKCQQAADFKTLKQMVLDTISEITFTCSECNKKSSGKRWGIEKIKDKIFCSKDCTQSWQKKNQESSEQGEINSNGNEEEGIENEGEENNFDNNSNIPNSNNNHQNIPNQPNQTPNQNENGQENNNDEPSFIQEIAKLPLPQAQEKAEQEIEKLLKDNSISDQELEQEEWLGKSNWKNYLKSLDTPQKVVEFTKKMHQTILSKVFNRTSTPTQKKPKNDLIKPIAIIVLSLLVLATIIVIIIRKRRQKHF